MKQGNTTLISLKMPTDLLKRVDKLAELGGLNRSKIINNMVEVMTDGMELSGKVGLLQFAIVLRDLDEVVVKWGKAFNKKTKFQGIDFG